MSSNNDELIAQFIEISGSSENEAKFYLSSSNWSVEEALSNFLGNQGDNDTEMNSESSGGGGVGAGALSSSEGSGGNREEGSSVAGSSSGDKFAKTSGAAKPKFATLNDMSQSSAHDDDEGQAFYAGGSERSGQQVLGPPKRKNFREQLTDMFRMAHEHSAGPDQGPNAPSTSSGSVWGQGVRLGMTDTDHTVVNPAAKAAAAAGGEKKPAVVLKLWSQGFSVDDGELRLYDDPENKEFLETVMRGEIPHELLEIGWTVNVDVEDHRHEDYKKAPTKMSFKGSGHALGSPTPNMEVSPTASSGNVAAPSAAPPANTPDDEKLAKEKLKVNAAAPTTTLQIRLADGTRLAAQFNVSHTVADIHSYIQTARPQYANRNFLLVSSFPTRELKDHEATIEVAGLKNAALMQRLI